jgi:hypothetical protein
MRLKDIKWYESRCILCIAEEPLIKIDHFNCKVAEDRYMLARRRRRFKRIH